MKKIIVAISVALALLATTLSVFAEEARHLPDARPDGRMCQRVKGDIHGLYPDYSSLSGTTYYTTTKYPLSSPLVITRPFSLSLYDADGGKTMVDLHQANGPSETLVFSGANDAWAQTYTLTIKTTDIDVRFPKAHFSTHLCFLEIVDSASLTETIPPTPTPPITGTITITTTTPVSETTGLNPALEPAQDKHLYFAVVSQ